MRLDGAPPLEGPGRAGCRVASGSGSLVISGGGMAAAVSTSEGLVGAWEGLVPWAVPLVRVNGAPLPVASALIGGAGGWRRELPLAGMGVLEERGLLQDVLAVPVVQWTWRPPSHPDREGIGGADRMLTLSVAPPGAPGFELFPNTPFTVALVAESLTREAAERIRAILAPLAARERQRHNHRADVEALEITVQPETGDSFAPIESALLACEDAALGHPPGVGPTPPFLAGSTREVPGFLEGTHLAEFALAALLAGRSAIAGAAISALATEDAPPPSALVHLAAEWAMWTGDLATLLGLRQPLAGAIEQIVTAPHDPPPPAAWPERETLLERLADALEPAGAEAWVAELRSLRAAMDRARGVRLPVLGGPARPGDGDSPPAEARRKPPLVPPPEAFPDRLLGPAGPRDTVLAARLVRSWMEGVIGARPDAGYGRLRLGPELRPGWRRLTVRGITQGAVRVSLDCLREGTILTFVLRQDFGRVPVNLIFEPLLPVRGVESVRMGEEEVDVTLLPETGGIRLRCQFPLDPERRLTVVTTP